MSKTLQNRNNDGADERSSTHGRPPLLPRAARGSRLCERCFARNEAGDTFCKVCGEELPEGFADLEGSLTRRLVPAAARAQLIVEMGDAYGGTAEFWIESDVTLVGRSSESDGVSPDVDLTNVDPGRLVSRRHAFILRRRGGFVVEDLESANGTYLNGMQRLQPHAQTLLRDGDLITFGEARCTFWTVAASILAPAIPALNGQDTQESDT